MLTFIQLVGGPIASDSLVTQLNKIRIANGLGPLQENSQLYLSANNKACDINDKRYWSHTDPADHTFDWWISKAGYNFYTAGENLARNFSDDSAMINNWMDSPSHKTNILSTDYTEIGVGRCGNYIVLHFGRR